MNLISISIFIINIYAFRLITLDQLGEKNKNIFMANIDSKPKLQRVASDNISNFYVVVHSNKIFFYTKGNYHAFAYDTDNVKLKLSPVELGKVQFYTQENLESDHIHDNSKQKAIKVMKWDDLIKKPVTRTNVTVSKRVEHFRAKPEVVNEQAIIFHTQPKVVEEEEDEFPVAESPSPNENIKANYTDLIKNLYEIMKTPNKNSENISNKVKKDIESDSEMLGPKSLNIVIDVINNTTKTFVLKNDKNMCVTYFKKTFLLTECTKSKRQVFKLVKADEVLGAFQDQVEKPKEQDDEFLNEIATSSSSSSEKQNSEEKKRKGEKRKIKRPGKMQKRPKRGQKKNEEEEEDNFPKNEEPQENPKSSRSVRNNDHKIADYRHGSPSEPKQTSSISISQPLSFESHCRALLQKNNGKINQLPPGCDRVLNVRKYPLPNQPFTLSMRMTQRPQVASDSREIAIESREEAKANANFFPQNQNDPRPINLIERLEREIKL